MLLQRIFASVLLLACLGLALMAWPYQASFSYEPVGPRAFPLLMLGPDGPWSAVHGVSSDADRAQRRRPADSTVKP